MSNTLSVRRVHLRGGRSDGLESIASHDTAIAEGEVYVWDGGDDKNRFVHALTALANYPTAERERVQAWMNSKGPEVEVKGTRFTLPPPMSDLIGIPPWRINAWLQVIRYGERTASR